MGLSKAGRSPLSASTPDAELAASLRDGAETGGRMRRRISSDLFDGLHRIMVSFDIYT